MTLQNAINFIKGSIATSEIIPHMRNVTLAQDSITAENGITKATYRLEQSVDCSVCGNTLVQAIKAAGKDAKLRLTKGGQLRVSAGGFSSFLPTQEGSLAPVVVGNKEELPENFVEILAQLLPFVAIDGQQYWAGGVLFSGKDLFATDSKTLVQIRAPWNFENTFVLPFQGIKELLRIKESPLYIDLDTCTDPKFVNFVYEDAHTFTVYPLDGNWPNIKNILDESNYKQGAEIDEDFFKHLSKLRPFVGDTGSVYLKKGKWRTSPHANIGAIVPCTVDYEPSEKSKRTHQDAVFGFDQLMTLQGVATKINLGTWPENVPFTGQKLRGVIAGKLR